MGKGGVVNSGLLATKLANGLFLVIGSLVLVYLFDLNMPDLFVMSFFFAVLSLSLTLAVGRGYDVQGPRCPAPDRRPSGVPQGQGLG